MIRTEGVCSLRKTAKRLGVCLLTAFDWRHKILLSTPMKLSKKFKGEIFGEELWFSHSQKGRRNIPGSRRRPLKYPWKNKEFITKLVAFSDSEHMEMKVVCLGEYNSDTLNFVFENKFRRGSKIYFRQWTRLFRQFSRENALNTVFIEKGEKKLGVEKGVEKLDSFQELTQRFRTFINKELKGVSTKYLPIYVDYYAYKQHNEFDPLSERFLNLKYVWFVYVKWENKYFYFNYYCSEVYFSDFVKREWKATNEPINHRKNVGFKVRD